MSVVTPICFRFAWRPALRIQSRFRDWKYGSGTTICKHRICHKFKDWILVKKVFNFAKVSYMWVNHLLYTGNEHNIINQLCMRARWVRRVWLFVTPWTVAHQIPLSMGFSRQEYWSGLPYPPPGDLSNPAIEPMSSTSQVDSLLPSHRGSPGNQPYSNIK